jgi:short-subunit dehydrogenase
MTYRSALITGASSGIGEAMAGFLPVGTDLLLQGRDPARLAAVAKAAQRTGRRVETIAVDLAAPGGAELVAERGLEFGVDLLVNNAGIGREGRLDSHTLADEIEMIAVNVAAPVIITRQLLPGMIERARGAGGRAGLIIVSSVVGFGPVPFFATYSATKAFDLRWAEALAEELSSDPIDVLALCPGSTVTRFSERAGTIRNDGHSAERVAREGLEALGKRRVHVVGGGNQAVTMAFKLLPGRFMAMMAARALAVPK